MADKDDKSLAEKLFPVFVDTGSISAVLEYCKDESISISKPTLYKMRDLFGWESKRNETIKSGFAAVVSSGNPLLDLLVEIVTSKQKIKNAIETSPADKELHRLNGMYISQMLDALKEVHRQKKKDEVIKDLDQQVKTGGLSDEAAAEIRKKILGIGNG